MKLDANILDKLSFGLRVEIEENAQREPLTQSELAAEQKLILAELRKHTRQGKRTDLTSGNSLPEVDRSTDIVGRIFNESREQVKRRLAVVDAAEAEPERFGPLVVEMDRTGKVSGAYRQLNAARDEERVLGLAPVAGKFRTLVVDPGWEYEALSLAGRAKPGYAMRTPEQLFALDLKQWAEPDCELYCWTTNNFSGRAHELVAHWGFQHRVILTWVKPPPFGLGSYFRNSTEHVLYATLGKRTTRPAAASIPTHFEAPRGEQHSEKPEKFYEIVRAASYPPYGEGNQRKARPDFQNLFTETKAAQ